MGTKHRTLLASLMTAIAFVLLFALIGVQVRSTSSQIEADFINVGQGDSILLRDGNGFDVLVDEGRTSAGPVVLSYLRAHCIADIDVLVATHADADHIGGLIAVLQANDIPVLQVLYNGYPGTTQTWANFVTAVANEGMTPAPAQFPAEYVWGGMAAHVLNPLSGLVNQAYKQLGARQDALNGPYQGLAKAGCLSIGQNTLLNDEHFCRINNV